MPADFGIGEGAAAATAAEAGSAAAASSAAAAAGTAAASTAAAAGAAGAGTGFLATLMSAAPYVTLASTAIQVVSSIAGAASRYSSAGLQEQQYEEQGAIAKTQALEQQTQRDAALMQAIGTSDAMRAGRGVDLYSPTGLNINRVSEQFAAGDTSAITANEKSQIASADIGAEASQGAQVGAIVGGVGDVVGQLSAGRNGDPPALQAFQKLMSQASTS